MGGRRSGGKGIDESVEEEGGPVSEPGEERHGWCWCMYCSKMETSERLHPLHRQAPRDPGIAERRVEAVRLQRRLPGRVVACGVFTTYFVGRSEQQRTSSHIAWSTPLFPSTSSQTSQPSSRPPTTHGQPKPLLQPRPRTLFVTSTPLLRHSRLTSRPSLRSLALPPSSSRQHGRGSGRMWTSSQAGDGSPS